MALAFSKTFSVGNEGETKDFDFHRFEYENQEIVYMITCNERFLLQLIHVEGLWIYQDKMNVPIFTLVMEKEFGDAILEYESPARVLD